MRTCGVMFLVGPEAERRYGRRNFMELLAVFTTAPEFVVLHGRQDVGGADPLILMRKAEGPRVLALAGRSWRVTHIDWARQRCYVEPTDLPGRSLWQGTLPADSFELAQAQRAALLGTTPDVHLSQRATTALAAIRRESSHRVWAGGTVVERAEDQVWWWTWAGGRGNATLAAALERVVDPDDRAESHRVRLRCGVDPKELRAVIDELSGGEFPSPQVADDAIGGLKFAEVLPPALATSTPAERLGDGYAAQRVVSAAVRWSIVPAAT